MSEDLRKNCRTQGKYSDKSQYCEDKRPQKSRDKRQKVSPATKEPQEKRFHKRRSDGGKGSNTSLEDIRKPIEIKTAGKHVLSSSENGESVILYEPNFFENNEAEDFFDRLWHTTNWHEKNIVIHGVEYPQPRLVAWYGPFPYSYSGATLEPAEMPDCVLEVKKKVEGYLKKQRINVELNSVLLNLYRNNKDSVSWHSDDEFSMGVCPTIASVSLGETRKFEIRRKLKSFDDESSYTKGDEYFVHLNNGSLLIMDGCMQKDWQHRVPKEYHDRGTRINLTFRTVYKLENVPCIFDDKSKNLPVDIGMKKSYKSKINFDEENFPPLSSDTSPSSSGITNICHGRPQDFSFSLKADNEINESEEEWEIDPRPSFKFDNISKERLDSDPFNKTVLRVDNEFNKSCEKSDKESPSNKIPLKTDNEFRGKHKKCNCESSSQNRTSLKTDIEMNESEVSFDEKRTLLNNLSDDKKNIKTNMQNKNLHAYDSSNIAMNTGEKAGRNKNYNMNERHNVSPHSPISNTQENVYEGRNEPVSSTNNRWTPNVEAEEFVPVNALCEDNTFCSFELDNLLHYKVDVMSRKKLFDYAAALKNRVLEKIDEFKIYFREELKFLCEITDGNQSEKNQKLITTRMCDVVCRALEQQLVPNNRKSYGNSRQQNHGNQNRYSERWHQGHNRSSNRRF